MQSTDMFTLGHFRDRLLIFLQSMPHHMFMNRFSYHVVDRKVVDLQVRRPPRQFKTMFRHLSM